MPKFLEAKLKKAYPGNPRAVYGTLNKIGAMRGSQETEKGAEMQRKHDEMSKFKGEAHSYSLKRPKRKVLSRYSH